MKQFEARSETQRRWKDRRAARTAGLLAIMGVNLLRFGRGGMSLLVLVAATGLVAVVARLAISAVDRRRNASLPAGDLHAVGACLLLDELLPQYPEVAASVRKGPVPWLSMGRVSGVLTIAQDSVRWVPHRFSRRWPLPALELPMAAIDSVEIVSAASPVNFAGVEIRLADGRHLAIESRGADQLRAAFARTALGSSPSHGTAARPVWRPAPSRPMRPRLAHSARFGLLGSWVALFVLMFRFLGDSGAGGALQTIAALAFFLLGFVAIALLVLGSTWARWLSPAAASAGLVASLCDFGFDPGQATRETAIFAAFLAVTIWLGRRPLVPPGPEGSSAA